MNEINILIEGIMNFNYLEFISQNFSLLTFELFLKGILIYFFVVWIAIIVWVTRDISNRTNNIVFQILSLLTVVIGTPLGIFVYLLFRPGKTLFEKYYEEANFVNDDMTEFEGDEILKKLCPHCNYEINTDYKFCPNCRNCLKKSCISCGKDLKSEWAFCSNCGKDQNDKINIILSKKEDLPQREKSSPVEEKMSL